jgi:chromosome partitioning protein
MSEEKNAKVIAVGNQKGGVAKTTNAVHLAVALTELGRKVLLWDLDAHAGTTKHFGITPGAYWGTFEVLTGEDTPENIILTDNEEDVKLPKNLHLITASRNLEGVDKALGPEHKFFPASILREPLNSLRPLYDYIILDTGPNSSTPTLAAYMAADYFILSTTPQAFSIQGIQEAVGDIQGAIRQGNSRLVVLGVIVSDVEQRHRIAKRNISYLNDLFRSGGGEGPSACFNTIISRSTIVGEAQDRGTTLFETDPSHKITQQFRELAREIEERLGVTSSANEIMKAVGEV